MKFRNDIAFLRAISVVAVLLYHFKFTAFAGGFIGVDLFFVISGYLMTRIILNGFSNGDFNLIDFYKKRVVRIFPALLVMITFFAIIIYFFIPTQFISYLKDFFASSLFFSNIYYYLNSGYFDASAQYNFLLHTWSLSVEWQFYMIYPLLLLLFRKIFISNPKNFKIYFFGLLLLSLFSMLIHSINDKSYSFYIFYPRAWEMMFGGVAFLYENHVKKVKQQTKYIIVVISLMFIGLFIYKTNSLFVTWPSLLTIIPVSLTAIVILLNMELRLFNNKVVKYVGDISYSLYLYHWPFYVLSLFFAINDRLRYRLLFILLSFLFAVSSYHIIEKKATYNKYRFIIGSAVLLFVVSLSITKANVNYFFGSYNANLVFTASEYKFSDAAFKQYSLEKKHLMYYQKFNESISKKWIINNNEVNVVLLGDSHAAMFSQTMNNIFNDDKYNLIQITADATFPMSNSETNYKGSRDLFNYFFNVYYPKFHQHIDLVVINSNYLAYDRSKLSQKINFTENYFKKYRTTVYYIGQTDNYTVDFPTYFFLNKKYNVEYVKDAALKEQVTDLNNYLKEKLGDKYINILDQKINKTSNLGDMYIYDTNHLTYYGTQQYFIFLQNKLQKKSY